MLRSRINASLLSLILVSTLGAAAFASLDSNQSRTAEVTSKAYLHSYNLPASGLAIDGYCPVAYFAVNKPVRGRPEFAATHNGVTYYFVSADARAEFNRHPEKYIPAYGGWCAFGMAVEDKFPVDPTNFKIINGRLHLFLRNQGVDALKLWNDGDEKALLTKADRHWKQVQQ